MKKIQTIIIGLGKVGFGNIKDYRFYRSHSYTIFRLKSFNLIGAIEKKKPLRLKFKKKYNIEAYKNIYAIKKRVDLVIVATNIKNHYKCLKDVLKYLKPKYILCEKPFTDDYYLAKKIHDYCKKNNINLFVNYVRRCLPSLSNFKKILNKKSNQNYVNILYPKGVLNNGSHFIDLCIFVFGKIKTVEIGKKVNKFDKDFNIDFKLRFKNAEVDFSAHHKNKDSRISIVSKKLSLDWEKGKKIKVVLDKKSNKKKFIESGMKSYQYYVMKQFLKKIKNQKNSICNSSEALKTLEVIKKLKNAT